MSEPHHNAVFYCGCGACAWACSKGEHRQNCPHDTTVEVSDLRNRLRLAEAVVEAARDYVGNAVMAMARGERLGRDCAQAFSRLSDTVAAYDSGRKK